MPNTWVRFCAFVKSEATVITRFDYEFRLTLSTNTKTSIDILVELNFFKL